MNRMSMMVAAAALLVGTGGAFAQSFQPDATSPTPSTQGQYMNNKGQATSPSATMNDNAGADLKKQRNEQTSPIPGSPTVNPSASNNPDMSMQPSDMNKKSSGGMASATKHSHRRVASAGKDSAWTAKSTAKEDRETNALNLLAANGYANFSQFRPDGNNFDATVTDSNNRSRQVAINPDTQQVNVIN